MTTNEWITLFLSVTALIISIVLTISQIIIARAANRLPVGIDLLREYRSTEFKDKAKKVYTLLSSTDDFNKLNDEQIHSIDYISHFYDNLGLLIFKKVIPKSFILPFMGGNARCAWEKFQSYIQFQRVKRSNKDYQSFFEYLAKESKDSNEEKIRKKLGLDS